MAALRKGTAKGGGVKPPPPPPKKNQTGLVVDAAVFRERMRKLTGDKDIAADPVAVQPVAVTPTGFLSLDYALGVGGVARGRMHAVEGPPDAGKTALVAAMIGAFQRFDPSSVHVFLAIEPHSGDEVFLRNCGVDTDPNRFIILRPESAEEAAVAMMIAMGYVEDGRVWKRDTKITPVSSISWDSWGGSPVDTMGMAPLARVGSDWWSTLVSKAHRSNTTLFVTNHLHTRPGVSFGDPRYGTGGESFKYNQTTRLWITAMNVEKDETTKRRIAHDLKVDVVRNKVAPAFTKAFLHLNYTTGFDRIVDAFKFLESRGVSLKEKADGTTYVFRYGDGSEEDQVREVGEKNFLDALRGDPWAGEAFLTRAQALAKEGLG